MSNTETATARHWKRPPILIHDRRWRIAIYGGGLIYLVLAIASLKVNWVRVYEGLERGWRMIQGFLTPDFTSRWSDISQGLVESLTMSVLHAISRRCRFIWCAGRSSPCRGHCRKSSSPSCSWQCSASVPSPGS
jgi:hypothetical protein